MCRRRHSSRSYRLPALALAALMGALITSPVLAQTPGVDVTYNDENGDVTNTEFPIDGGQATGALRSRYEGDGNSVDSGDQLIINPVIDPRFNMDLTIINGTDPDGRGGKPGIDFVSYQFSLPEGIPGLYFLSVSDEDPFYPSSDRMLFSGFGRPVGEGQFLDLFFSIPNRPTEDFILPPVAPGEEVNFKFVMVVPEPTVEGTPMILDQVVGSAADVAPEPGTLSLLLWGATTVAALPLHRVVRRRVRVGA